MIQAFQTAVAGLRASTQRFGITAQNVANSRSEGYVPQKAVQTTDAGGAPRVTAVEKPPVSAGLNLANDPRVGASGVTGLSDVDLAQELVEARRAAHTYKANLAVLSVALEMNGTLVDRKG